MNRRHAASMQFQHPLLTLASGYRVALRKRIVDRLVEREAQAPAIARDTLRKLIVDCLVERRLTRIEVEGRVVVTVERGADSK